MLRIDRVELVWSEDEHGLSCVAKAEVSYPIGADRGDRRLEWLTSGGLYGIDTRSAPNYKREVEREQLADLSDHLSHFGMSYGKRELAILAAHHV